MRDKRKNIAQSVRDRLQSVAIRSRLDYNLVLKRYVFERFLYRLSASSQRDRFALKGAMLFVIWMADIILPSHDPADIIRPSYDIDLLSLNDSGIDALRDVFRDIMSTSVVEDGVTFDIDSIHVAPIREKQNYQGARISALSFIGTTPIKIQIDIGFGDAVTPELEKREYPTLLDARAPRLKTYPRETVVAEKFETIVDIGTINSRMKDYYDLLFISRHFAFEGRTLSSAIRATFDRRKTKLPDTVPPALSKGFAASTDAINVWDAFVQRTPLLVEPPNLIGVVKEITRFVMPPAFAAASEEMFTQNWRPSKGWTTEVPDERT